MDLIYNQNGIPREQYRYGLRSSAAVGCGWIATYNALALMGYQTDIPELIRYYERQLPVIHGNAGTSFWAPVPLFRKWGFPLKTSLRPSEFDALAREADACILFYRWREKWKLGAHFVALHKQGGSFVGYNTYRNSTGPDPYGPSLELFLKKQGYFTPFLIAIRKRPQSPDSHTPYSG